MPLYHRIAVPLASAAFALAGCGADGPSGDDAPLVFTAADLHVLGTSDSLAVVEDLAVLDDGTVWIQNSVEPFTGGRVWGVVRDELDVAAVAWVRPN